MIKTLLDSHFTPLAVEGLTFRPTPSTQNPWKRIPWVRRRRPHWLHWLRWLGRGTRHLKVILPVTGSGSFGHRGGFNQGGVWSSVNARRWQRGLQQIDARAYRRSLPILQWCLRAFIAAEAQHSQQPDVSRQDSNNYVVHCTLQHTYNIHNTLRMKQHSHNFTDFHASTGLLATAVPPLRYGAHA